MNNALRAVARVAIEAIGWIALAPFLLIGWVLVSAHSAWRRFELWAYYNGDEAQRAKDEWGRS